MSTETTVVFKGVAYIVPVTLRTFKWGKFSNQYALIETPKCRLFVKVDKVLSNGVVYLEDSGQMEKLVKMSNLTPITSEEFTKLVNLASE